MTCINLRGSLGHIIDFEKLSQDSIVVDCGVCVGEFIFRLDEEVDTSKFRIIGFEPCKTNLKNMPQWPEHMNIKIHDKAIVGTSSPEYTTFYEFTGLSEWGNVTGLEASTKQKLSDSLKYKVETTTLEKMFDNYDISHIDYLKLDTEGTETDIVKTMTQDVANKINQISMEVHNKDEKGLELILKSLGFNTRFDFPNELYGSRI
tara:strand:- start:104 stop:715 length:612 start_codon:yes stop_codon:yes gene_type:complete